jgi:aminoglycoside phosphotransferase (APT) family kinase protein
VNDALIDLYKKLLHLEDASFSRIKHSDAIIATVYKISKPNGKKYILKICPRDEHYFCEVYFLKYFADSLPVPYIVKTLEPTSDANGAVLMEYLEGSILTKETLTESLAKEIGLLLAKIHTNKPSGYGDLTKPNNLSTHPYTYFNFKFEEEFNECKGNLPNKLLDQCLVFYNRNIKNLDFVDGPCVTHRDFRPGNVIVHNNKVQGIIDWSRARASFAEEDFYQLEFGKWTNNNVLKKSILAGYESVRPVPKYSKVMPLLALSAAIATLGFTIKSGTWKTNNALLYSRKRQLLEELIAKHINSNKL